MSGGAGERRAVVTGIGVVAPSGIGAQAHWRTVLAGECRIGRIGLFDPSRYATTLAGEVPGFDASDHMPSRLAVQTDRWSWMAFAAVTEAFADAGLDPATLNPYSVAVALASSSGGNQFGQAELQRLWSRPDRTVSAYQSIAWFYAASVGQVAIRHGLKGPSSVLVSESAGGLDSLAHAVRSIRRGASVVLAGGTEGPLSPYALACQQRSGWLSTRTAPERAYLPFDADASGYVPGEGGAVLLVEELEHARSRGAAIYGEVTGWAATHDGQATLPRRDPPAEHYRRALELALRRAGVAPQEIGMVAPDALGVPGYDAAEAAALSQVFGAGVPATTIKPLIGRLYQGGSALDAATALLAMRHGTVPATAGPARPAEGCPIGFVREHRQGQLDAALIGARGFDGYNSALVLQRYDEEAA